MRNSNEIFKKDVTYNNTKSHKKAGFRHLFRRYIFRKTTGGVKLAPPAVLGLKASPSKFRLLTSMFFYVNNVIQ